MRVANKAMEELYATIRQTGGTMRMLDRMQTRAQLYEACHLETSHLASSTLMPPRPQDAAGDAGMAAGAAGTAVAVAATAPAAPTATPASN